MIYIKDGKKYRKLNRYETIPEGAMNSWNHGELQPIMNTDGETVGMRHYDLVNNAECYCESDFTSTCSF